MKPERQRPILIEPDRNIGVNKKYTTIALYAILIILLTALLVYLFISPDQLSSVINIIKSILSPILIGLVIAYLLYPIYRFFEKKVFISPLARQKQKCRRSLFQAKLRYDFVRRKHPEDTEMIEGAASALTDARRSLENASEALEKAVCEKDKAFALRTASQKKVPSFERTAPPSRKNIGKPLSLAASYFLLILVVSLFAWMIIPPCIKSAGELFLLCRKFISKLPQLLTDSEFGKLATDLLSEFGIVEELQTWIMNVATSTLRYLTSLLGKLPSFLTSLISNLTDLILGVFLSIYFLSSREFLLGQFKKFFRALLPASVYSGGRHILQETNRKFGKYIQGKLMSSAILGIVSFILFWLTGIPYFQMITLITTVTNLIPFFGPFIGAIPSGIIILIAAPDKLLIFIILVLILQQLEGNILEPQILGDSLGLSPVWIMIAIVVMGELFGIMGMVLGVPFFAVIYTLISETCNRRLKKK